ncbi:MAG: hypothetical protein JRN20_20005 [Nitrososphaerota archaeon]|nr:hypothetical protein [Nitrososphaerota archaeon]
MNTNPQGNVEMNALSSLVESIRSLQTGLDPQVLARWYEIVERESKMLCPTEELRDSIFVVQDPLLPMKFEFKSSKRAIPFVVQAIETNLDEMPYATRLYFQKFEEIMQEQLREYMKDPQQLDPSR